ncbi:MULTISPECIES: hypothetical protein [unclassified Haloferax]|uniref:hypothetical protein n=1 Tax=unclassified Haloferax TaxID=2625095 RepID=UPI0028749C5B|nr:MULTISPECIES: hypothetical protein [unclassified Haloferax]MDS0243731.1 hypothetical protein [Haloferax sp. S2CR25]MDS0446852.1 hypothetical protein [Haloferax sp. S2CR25-2]
MGLKSGSRDAGLDDSEDDVEQEQGVSEAEAEPAPEPLSTDTEDTDTEPKSASESEPKSEPQRPTMASIPYKLRRDKVNEGREQVPYFLREEIIDGETELQDTLEELLDEKVYKSDYREAAMVVAQRHPELIAEVLREWGYDLK